MATFRMPSLGSDMEDGTLVEWLKAPGDAVTRGEIIAVVETQKGAIEVECFDAGIFDRALVAPGTRVPVGTPLAEIRAPGETTSEPPPATAPPPPAASPEPPPAPEPIAPGPVAAPAAPSGTRLHISPAARRRAEEAGLDLSVFAGATEPIGLAEVEARLSGAAAEAPKPEPLSEMRRAIAAAMERSKREIPHYYLAHDIDLTDLEARLASANAGRPPEDRLLPGAVYVQALARTLKKYPEFNGHFLDGALHASDAVHAGMAIRLRGGGLVAPAILDAQAMDLDQIMAALRDLVARARTGRFRSREFAAATITLTSLGERGVDVMTGVITPPQVAILGLGTPARRPWVVDDAVVPRSIATLTLAADHRVSDGHRGALFLNALARNIATTEIP